MLKAIAPCAEKRSRRRGLRRITIRNKVHVPLHNCWIDRSDGVIRGFDTMYCNDSVICKHTTVVKRKTDVVFQYDVLYRIVNFS